MNRSHVLLLIFLSSCIQPFETEPLDFERLLVVDGSISNIDEEYFVRLSYTRSIEDSEIDPVSGANVTVVDGSGVQYQFEEKEVGIYGSPEGMIGKSRETYQLQIEVSGQEYQSNLIELKDDIPIDSVHHSFVSRLSEEGNTPLNGIQFFVDSHSDTDEPLYFRYEWEDTYQIKVPIPSFYEYDFTNNTVIDRVDDIGTCYTSNESIDILIATSSESAQNRIADYPIQFLSEAHQALRSRYSILVKQFSIDAQAYSFYRQIQKNNENSGSLNEEQVGLIAGNIKSITNPEEVVLGYFEVAGTSQKRTFFNSSEYDEELTRPNFRFNCIDPISENPTNDSIGFYLQADNTLRIISLGNSRTLLVSQVCSDCSWYASLEKPDFWID